MLKARNTVDEPRRLFRSEDSTPEPIGRNRELASIERFLDDPGARALLVEGEPGIGKTTVWRAGIESAGARGHTVLVARPAFVEGSLSLSGLGDLLRDVPHRELNRLAQGQQRALGVALAGDDPSGAPVARGVVAMAVLGLVTSLAATAPLLLAVDDLQWLDEGSAAVLVYTLRRAGSSPVRLLASCRADPGEPPPLGLAATFDEQSLLRLRLGPLSEGAIRRLLRLRLGLDLSRAESHAVFAASMGNPFFALELGRAGVELDRWGAMRLAPSLRRLLDVRLERLPAPTRNALLFVAASGRPGVEVLARVGALDALGPALETGVLEFEGERVRFAHPLVASAAWGMADDAHRADVHRLLADAVVDVEARALHLAAVAEPPDESVADLLEEAAATALRRGAPAAAAELLDRARGLLDPNELARWAQLTERAAGANAEAGHWDRVRDLIEEARTRLPPGPERAAILVVGGEMGPRQDGLFRQAIAEAGDTPAGARARIGLVEQAALGGRWSDAAEAASDAVDFARRIGDPAQLGLALAALGGQKLLDSRSDGIREIEQAIELDRRLHGLPTTVYQAPETWRGIALLFADDPVGAGAVFEERLAVAQVRGDEMSAFQAMQLLIFARLRAGDWAAARTTGGEARELVESLGFDYGRAVLLSALATMAAYEGELDRARALGHDAVSSLAASGDGFWSILARAALVLGELCAGNAAAAVAHAEAVSGRFPGRECWWSDHQGDEIEALVLAGEPERALVRIDELRSAGLGLGVLRFLAWADRGEGLVRAAEGDLTAAASAFESSLAHHEQLPLPFQRARTLLGYGHVLRRANRRREARAVLNASLLEFEHLGACHFARETRVELGHVGGRAPSGEHELTHAEERVARLVARGLANKEVAAELFVTVGTVEATLTHVYRKLGLRSRAQLARAFVDRETDHLLQEPEPEHSLTV